MAGKKCKCGWCKLYARYKRAMASKSLKKLRAFTEKVFDLYNHTSEDLNYRQAILDGSWPTAIEQLERALNNAREFQAARPDLYPRTENVQSPKEGK